ncbi:hypothetical protein [Zunongwangia pacifica]|uniref:Lipoprotein n=1 Tax=Zunongwangia pacifica TaxID=2911062 RepID=A0A9X1ZPY2_9FLAO|nr:hypothetical protein [Zunongwangia pacifica]MCL6217150.1 hypothetical protein [Zunongwangia pacifica]
MKKTSLILFFALAISLISCNNDDGPSIAYGYAKITGHNLPTYIEYDESYDIKATYKLINACHNFVGFDARPYENEDEEKTLIINVSAITSYDPNITECNKEGNLTSTKSVIQNGFKLSRVTSNKEQYNTVRFRFLTNVNSENEGEYITVNLPVGEPEPEETPTE